MNHLWQRRQLAAVAIFPKSASLGGWRLYLQQGRWERGIAAKLHRIMVPSGTSGLGAKGFFELEISHTFKILYSTFRVGNSDRSRACIMQEEGIPLTTSVWFSCIRPQYGLAVLRRHSAAGRLSSHASIIFCSFWHDRKLFVCCPRRFTATATGHLHAGCKSIIGNYEVHPLLSLLWEEPWITA